VEGKRKMKKGRGINIFLLSVILFAIVMQTGCLFSGNKEQVESDKYIPVEITEVERKTIYSDVMYTGRVYPDKEVFVVPSTPGKVLEVKVKTGALVKEGDVLFTLDTEDVQNQVEQAQLALNGALANYEMTLEKVEAARKSYKRSKQLYEEGSLSESQLEQAELAASDKPLKVAYNSVEQARFTHQKAVEALDDMTITSPISGMVASLNVEKGEYALNSQPSAVVMDIGVVKIRISAVENIINRLYEGQKASVRIPAVSDEEYTGSISTISPSADERSLLYPVDISVENLEHGLKPGMFARTSIRNDVRENVIVVPAQAVVKESGNDVLYIEQDGRAVQRGVEIGIDTGEYIEIISGLDVGERVIIKGQSFVKDGDIVRVVGGETE
jgi:RND family efflux transporter MFP subunit